MAQIIKQVIIRKVDMVKLRKKAGLSLRELSRLTGINSGTLSRIENEKYKLSILMWERISFALDTSMYNKPTKIKGWKK